MARIRKKNLSQLNGIEIKDTTGPAELETGTGAEKINNRFPGYPYAGYHRTTIGDYLNGGGQSPYSRQQHGGTEADQEGLYWYNQHIQRLEMMIQSTGEPAVLLRRKFTGEVCVCYDGNRGQGRNRCPLCYGTGFIGGYIRYVNCREPQGRIWMRLGPTNEDLDLQEDGTRQKFIPECVVAGTLVETNNGCKRVEDIKIGELLKSFDITTNSWSMQKVIATQELLPKEDKLVKIKTRRGRELHCTINHPLVTKKVSKIEAGSLVQGDELLISPLASKYLDEDKQDYVLLTEDEFRKRALIFYKKQAYRIENYIEKLKEKELLPLMRFGKAKQISRLVGYIFGDGHITMGRDSVILAGEESEIKAVKKEIEELGYITTERRNIHESSLMSIRNGYSLINGEATALYINDVELGLFLTCLGAPIGNKTKQSYCIPEWIKSHKDLLREFLAVYYDNDGRNIYHLQHGKVHLGPVQITFNKLVSLHNEALCFAKELTEAFRAFGIETTIKAEEKDGCILKNGERTCKYSVTSGVNTSENWLKFIEHIGSRYNEEKLLFYSRMGEYQREKIALRKKYKEFREQVVELNKNGKSKNSIAKEFGFALSTIRRWCTKESKKTKADSGSIVYEEWIAENLQVDEKFYDQIESIEIVPYKEKVYDFTIENIHIVVWNGIIGYQCWTLPTPIVRDRDVIVLFDPETGEETWRYEILAVDRNRGMFRRFVAQKFNMHQFEKTDPIYNIDIFGTAYNATGDLAGGIEPGYDPHPGYGYTDPNTGYGEAYNDAGFSEGYIAGYEKGYQTAIANGDFDPLLDPDFYGTIESPYGADDPQYDTAGKQNYMYGWEQGYKDGWVKGGKSL